MKLLVFGLVTGLMLSTPAAAQITVPKYFDPNDYPALFASEEEQAVATGSGVRSVFLGDGIEVRQTSRNGGFSYRSFDNSEAGPVLCVVAIWTIFAQHAVVCSEEFDAEVIAWIDSDLDRLPEFVGENAFPRMDPLDYRDYLDSVISEGAADLKTCDQHNGMIQGLERFVAALKGDTIAQVLSTPRLPVLNPCFQP